MKAIDSIRWAMQFTDQGLARVVDGLAAAPLTRPTPSAKGGDGNHPLWSIGHLCVIEGGLRNIIRGEPNPVGHWWPLFGTGTQPSDDATVYPPFEEVLKQFHASRAYNLKLLEEIGEAGLDAKPINVPPGFENAMSSVGQTFLLIALHTMVHYGQVTDARRAAGLKPLM